MADNTDNTESSSPNLNMADEIKAAVTKALEEFRSNARTGAHQGSRGPPPHPHEGPHGEHHPPPHWGFRGPSGHQGLGGHHDPPPNWSPFDMGGHHHGERHGHGGPRGERRRRFERHCEGPPSRSASSSGSNTDGEVREGDWEDVGRSRRGSHGHGEGKRSRRGSHGRFEGKRSRRGSHGRFEGGKKGRKSHGPPPPHRDHHEFGEQAGCRRGGRGGRHGPGGHRFKHEQRDHHSFDLGALRTAMMAIYDKNDVSPAVNSSSETKSSYILRVALPGARMEDVNVLWDAAKGEVRVHGITPNLSSSEWEVGSFDRKIYLPRENVKSDAKPSRVYLDGILIITIPKTDVRAEAPAQPELNEPEQAENAEK